MARNVNLNSSDWCDIIFEGKNKAYGAYEMRQSSSKRHIISFGCVLVFTALVAVSPQLINAAKPDKELLGTNLLGGPTVVDMLPPEEPEEIPVDPSLPPPPPQMINTIAFPPPVITVDSNVREEDEMATQEELRESTAMISTVTYESENTTGVDPGEVLREQREITGDPAPNPDTPVDFVEIMPQYPGGNSEMMRYLSNNIKYPAISAENGIEGRVILKFVVGKDGSISNVRVLKGLDSSCDKEAVRVVKSMQKWIPGRQNGHPIAVNYTLPVMFKLQR